ncbi:hypothetical protein K438DRAFT_1970092 [Mycena galopus ATCC 62051]|nr:hypothetical protein K438DRAFT_1970092 [Mycena galopus ATCC 62051]
MPSAVHKIDMNSPLILYQGRWIRGGSSGDPAGPDADPEQVKYDQETFVFCFPGEACSATLNFNGTEIHVVGAVRDNTGPMQVELDGEIFGPLNPKTEPEQFQVDHFNKTNLVDGSHTLTISNFANSNGSTFDIDFFTWTSNVASLVDARFQDDHPAFVYEPLDAWSTDMTNLPGFDDGTGHASFNKPGATATLTFAGDRVALYGAIGGLGAPFTAQVDNGTVRTLTAQQSISDNAGENYLPNQLIFYADGLTSGNHTVVLSSQPVSVTQGLTIDYALVDARVNNASALTPTPTPSSIAGSSQYESAPSSSLSYFA